MDQSIISVIIPVYNPGKHLTRCLDSITHQTYPHLQIILVDDGSTDGSGAICDEYAARDSRVICIHQQNAGVSKARNAGIAVATGDYYNFPDSDDYLEPDTFQYLLSLIKEHQCDAVNFEYFTTWTDHEVQHQLDDAYYGLKNTREAHWVVLNGQPFACNKLFSKKLITGGKDLPGISFREDIYRGEDTLFAQYALDRAERVWFDQRPLYHYVQSEQSAVRGTFRTSQLSALKLYDAYKPLYQVKYPDLYPIFLRGMSHLMVSLYYDMWADEADYSEQQKTVYDAFKAYEKNVMNSAQLSGKDKVKLRLFSISPKLFCRVHQRIH